MKLIIVTRILVVMVAWFFCCYDYYINYDHNHFIDFLPVMIFIASLFSLVSVLFDRARYLQTKKIIAFFPTLVSLLCIGVYFGLRDYLLKQDRTPVVLHASYMRGFLGTTISIDFRENGTFKCGQSGLMSGPDFVRGKYFIKDSIIYLDRSDLHGIVKSNKLLMKSMLVASRKEERSLLKSIFGKPKYDTLPEFLLLQLNARGDTIPHAIRLNVDLISMRLD